MIFGAETSDFARSFLAPAMAHCGGGQGPNTLDALGAVEAWVEKGQAPNRIVAAHAKDGKSDRTWPLCPYPKVARYNGSGNPDDALTVDTYGKWLPMGNRAAVDGLDDQDGVSLVSEATNDLPDPSQVCCWNW